MDSTPNKPKEIVPLFNKVQQISLLRIESLCSLSGFSVGELVSARIVKEHWMAQIVMSGNGLRFFFRVYFASQVLKKWSEHLFKSQKESLSLNQTHDVAKEFCNLVAGELKSVVSHLGITVGTSLPCITRGFDRVFITPSEAEQYYENEWTLKRGEHQITCSAEIEFKGHFDLSRLEGVKGHSDEIEFF